MEKPEGNIISGFMVNVQRQKSGVGLEEKPQVCYTSRVKG